MLGIHRPTLYNKLRKYRLWRREDRFRKEAKPEGAEEPRGPQESDDAGDPQESWK
jgi:hypothetical protein